MDQAASVTSLPTSALYISFFPYFSSEPVLLPITRTTPKAVFVCANSLVVSDKVVGEYFSLLRLSQFATGTLRYS